MGKYLDKQGVETLWSRTKELNAQKQDSTSDELTTEAKEIVPAINEAAAAAKAAQERADVSAKTDGYYAEMRVGTADNLTARGDATTETFTRRTAGGDNAIEEGNATIKAIKGNSFIGQQFAKISSVVIDEKPISGITIKYAGHNEYIINGTATEAINVFLATIAKVGNSDINWIVGGRIGGSADTWNITILSVRIYEGFKVASYGKYGGAIALNCPQGTTFDDVHIQVIAMCTTIMFGEGYEPSSPDALAKRLGFDSPYDLLDIQMPTTATIIDVTATGMRTAGTDDDGLAWTQERSWKPVIDKYFGGHLRSAGNVRDEITANKAVKRIGAMAMKSTSWRNYSLAGGVNTFYALDYPKDFPKKSTNLLQTLYTVVDNVQDLAANDKSILNAPYINTTFVLLIHDESCATSDALIAKLKDNILYYESTAPQEYDIDGQNLTIKVAPDGTEEIIAPEGGDVIASAPVVADIVYPIDSYKTIKGNKAHIGSVASLATSAKSDLVAAINELTGRVAALETKATAETSTTEEEQ